MKLRNLIGEDVIAQLEGKNVSDTQPIANFQKSDEFYLDNSFFDNHDRVKKKYLAIPDFHLFYEMDLNELSEITNPSLHSRTAVLATTELLLPYIAYTIKYIENNEINIEKGMRQALPFLIYAPSKWSLKDNMHAVDIMSYLFKEMHLTNIRLILPTDKRRLFTPDGKPRTTLQELYRLYKNLGDVHVSVKKDGPVMIATLKHKQDGGRRRTRRLRTRFL